MPSLDNPAFKLVMVREGVPSTSFFVAGKLVDGRPTPTMTIREGHR
jgi:hypothetical protein